MDKTIDEKKMWESLKRGTFPQDFSKDTEYFLKDHRTALQKAIDSNEENVRVVRKKEVEEGDYRLFANGDWEQFCFHKAKNIVCAGELLVMQQYKNGVWEDVDSSILYKNLEKAYSTGLTYEKPVNHPVYGYRTEREYYAKVFEEDRDEQEKRPVTRQGVFI